MDSLLARAVASSRSIKISANIVGPPLVRGQDWVQCSRADVMAITKCRIWVPSGEPVHSGIETKRADYPSAGAAPLAALPLNGEDDEQDQ
jgi:hypothetical protein